MSDTKSFTGFSARTGFTPLPNAFFTAVLPQVEDLSELKVTLHVIWAIYRKSGYPKFITYNELRGSRTLVSSLNEGEKIEDTLRRSLQAAVDRQTLLHLRLERDAGDEDVYFVNADPDRQAIAKIESGEIRLGGLAKIEPASNVERPNIFELYEQHIGLLTPMIAEDLKEAESLYPASWIEEAFREAARLNKRSWRYVSRILERWDSEGKDDGTPGKHTAKELDPKDYLKKYGRFARK